MKKLTPLVLALTLVLAACSSAAEIAIEQLAEADDEVSNVEINDGEIKVEFEDEEGGGALVIGGGEIPDGFPIPVPDGGDVTSSIAQGNSYGVIINFPESAYDELVSFYEAWVADQSVEDLFTNSFESPRSTAWGGTIGEADFAVNVIDASDTTGTPGTMLMVNWDG
ncbi:MAG: hypothetical protein ABFR95_07885 [Actinomycetota bacterium]